jgi:hypothetical protein
MRFLLCGSARPLTKRVRGILVRQRCFIDEPRNVPRQLIAVPPLQQEDGIDRGGDKSVVRQRQDDVAQWD